LRDLTPLNQRVHNFFLGCPQGQCSNDVNTACAFETKIRPAGRGPFVFRPWSINFQVTVGQTTRQSINYFHINEAISMSEHRAPTYPFPLMVVSFTAYCGLFA